MARGWRVAARGRPSLGPTPARLERFVKPNDPVSEITTVVGFSPDSQWLLSRTNSTWAQRLQFWRTGTWETGQRADVNCGGGAFQVPVFTADGQLMAVGVAADQVLLADATTGRELVRLTTLRPIVPMPLAFSPDSTKLVAGTTQKTVIVWDLRRIRAQLASRGLDWDCAALSRVHRGGYGCQRRSPTAARAGRRRDPRNGVDGRPRQG